MKNLQDIIMEELPKNEKEHIMEGDTWLTPIEVFYKQGKNRKYKYANCSHERVFSGEPIHV